MKRNLIAFRVAAGLVLLAPIPMYAQASYEKTYLHPKIKDKELTLRKLVVLPPAIEVNKSGVKGLEGMAKEAEQATDNFSIEVAAALKEKGADVQTPFTADLLNRNDELKTALGDVQRQFDDAAPQIFDKKKDVRKGRFSLGDGVAILNTRGDADAFVIVRAAGEQQTATKAFMKGGLLGMALTSGKVLYKSRIALVDARNGEILFLGEYFSWGTPSSKLFEKSFKQLPLKE
jgi:hypothetical protein